MDNLTSDLEQIREENKQKFEFDIVDLSIENKAIVIIDNNPLYYDELKNWYAFNKEKKQWIKVDEVDIISSIKKLYKLSGLSMSNYRTAILNALKDEARYRKPEKLNDFQIQIGEYIYDIRNNNKVVASPEYLPSIIIDRNIENINEKDECLKIDKVFNDWVGEDKQTLYEIVAYCISPNYFLDICFWFVGKGENGKSLFTNIINRVVGFENVTSQDIEILSDPKDRFTKGFLRNKLVCSLGDGNPQVINHTKGLKTLSGCAEPIRGEYKGGGQVDFFNRAKLIGCFNTLPETSDKTPGFYRRQHITEFKNNFAGMKNPLPDIEEKEFDILTYKCFNILKEIYKNNDISGWGDYEERKNKYERLSNPIGLFIKDICEEDYNNYSFGKTLHKAYERYAIKKGYNTFKLDEFEARVINQGFEKKRKDVFHYEDKCWGKKKDVPKEIWDSKPEYEWDSSKFNVFFGLKIKNLDNLDKKDRVLGLDIQCEKTDSKKLSKLSKLSENKIYCLQELLDLGLTEDQVEKLREEGTIFKPLIDGYKLL